MCTGGASLNKIYLLHKVVWGEGVKLCHKLPLIESYFIAIAIILISARKQTEDTEYLLLNSLKMDECFNILKSVSSISPIYFNLSDWRSNSLNSREGFFFFPLTIFCYFYTPAHRLLTELWRNIKQSR